MKEPDYVLLVDGPGKGQLIARPDENKILWADDVPHPLAKPWDPPPESAPSTEPVTYKLGKAVVFGHLLVIASVRKEVPEGEVFDAIINDAAKRASVKLPRYRCQHQMSELPCILGCHDR